MLPDRHRRQPELLRELRRIDWPLGFQQFGNGATCLPLALRLHSSTHATISKEFSLQSQCSGVTFDLVKENL
jgi:hypothetical protein